MSAKDIEVVGEAHDGQAAIEMAEHLKPDVILMDIQMPRLDGLKATRRLVAAGNAARVVILSMQTDEALVRQAVRCGAWGYQIKNCDSDDLIATIRAVYQGQRAAHPLVAPFFDAGEET